MGRLFLPKFDGSSSSSAKAWVENLDIYFQLNKVPEIEAIKITALHFEGEGHNWWFHWLSTLGHANVTTYSEFTRILVEMFDRKDPEAPFMNLYMGWLNLQSSSLCMMPLRGLETSKMPFQKKRQLSSARPLTFLKGRKKKLLLPRRAHSRSLLTLRSGGS